ncbi:MAG TPA: hypothetical protein VMT72_13385 [Pseudolabrys sp.]|nr:hypothetical protein [Pseudolabrys sp.]
MTPISSPVNTLVVGPRQYSFDDFVKVGAPFTVVVAIVSVLFVPLFLPLGAIFGKPVSTLPDHSPT